MLLVQPALLRAPLVAGLVFDSNQCVGAATLFRSKVKIARSVPHAFLDMAPPALYRFQPPLLLLGVNQERP